MPTASVIPLHQKLLGGTVKAIIHHPTDFAGVQWDVLCNFVVLHFTGQKNLIYMCVFCPAVHMQVWTHDQCFIWTSPKRPKGGVWSSKRYTKSRILKTPIDPPLQTLLCSVNVLWKFFVLHFTRHYIYIFVLLFNMQVWTHDLCFIWSSPKRPKGGVWGSCVGCNTDTCKVCRGFEVTCKLTLQTKKP
jgi:hypothetical protein